MAENLQIGDTVKLNSGGPIMTITEEPSGTNNICTCSWYEPHTAKFETCYFSASTLKKTKAI
ncbi:DUF2158 domain-containing protein [Marinomonas fungiae]|uniref:Uncharacterized conserved protein YodC, DUF2158 family n=1 Tax=Marinomonas fungiae TaxID=1137284 RepID=A0A0K6IU48_9GAMM|nr:DUF2158 domain-containing protein [Marinomonas fungiae]CUB06636.1 Uncharacterized conserved protein YodC, DUF2158 family [Marinomonas fungiae]